MVEYKKWKHTFIFQRTQFYESSTLALQGINQEIIKWEHKLTFILVIRVFIAYTSFSKALSDTGQHW